MSGRLGAADIAAATDTLVYTVPADFVATVSVSMVNRDSEEATSIRIALVDGVLVDLADEDYIEYDTELCENSVIERTGVVMAAGESIVVRSLLANVSAVVYGWVEGA